MAGADAGDDQGIGEAAFDGVARGVLDGEWAEQDGVLGRGRRRRWRRRRRVRGGGGWCGRRGR
ncbi:MAG: hypothetical protein U0841_32985 [Chloroflexia bacterium]